MGSNRQIARNTAFLYLRMFIALLVSLYTSRVVLRTLGVVDFGIYNVVAGFVSLFSFLEATLSSSIQRYYNYEGTRQGAQGYQKVYSAGLTIQVAAAAIALVILESFGIWYINHVMVIPAERVGAANWLYQFSTLSLVVVLLQVPFNGIILARERIDFYSLVSILEVFLKLGIALALPHIQADKLVIYGFLLLAVTTCSTLLMVIYSRRKFKELRFSFVYGRDFLKEMISFSGWGMAGTFIFLLKGQGLNLLLNYFFGPAINAARGIAYQINTAINGFSSNINVAYRPQLVNSYAEKDFSRTEGLMFSESKICFALICMLITPVILEMDYLLHLWLGPVVPEHTDIFASLVLIDSLICTLNAPCTQIVFATGKISLYQIVSSTINIFLLPVCYVLLRNGYKAESVFVATIIFSCISQAVCLIVARRSFMFSWKGYFSDVLVPCLILSVTLPIIPYLIVRWGMSESIWRLILVCLATIMVAIPLSYFLILNKDQRASVLSFLSRQSIKQ